MIKVHATTINRTDCGILTGKPYLIRAFTGLRKPRHLVTGTDFAGEVVAVGASVNNFKIGDRVWGLQDEGLQSQAQYTCLSVKEAVYDLYNIEKGFGDASKAFFINNKPRLTQPFP